jgi:hypothetical protein
MSRPDVVDRMQQLRSSMPSVKLYALVDGAQYKTFRDKPLADGAGLYALFHGTPDEALAHAGPWLIDAEQVGESMTVDLAKLERQGPAVTWLMAVQDPIGLAQLLQLKLDTRLPDGRVALLRFWDPRVLLNLIEVLDPEQLEEFFAHIHEWHFLRQQERVWIGREHAHAQ